MIKELWDKRLWLLYRIPMPRSVYGMFLKETDDCKTVLDAGCGLDSILFQIGINHKEITGMDIWSQYVAEHQGDKRYKNYLEGDVVNAEFPDKSFDVVILSDVLEHIPKDKVLNGGLFEKLDRWAVKKVIMMLPSGFLVSEMWDGNPYMRHQSGWTADELRQFGFEVRGTMRVVRRKVWGITVLKFFWTLFCVKGKNEISKDKIRS